MLAKLTKNILRGVNFINLKIPSGYIAKSKSQGICLQLNQTLGGDYAIWPFDNDIQTWPKEAGRTQTSKEVREDKTKTKKKKKNFEWF